MTFPKKKNEEKEFFDVIRRPDQRLGWLSRFFDYFRNSRVLNLRPHFRARHPWFTIIGGALIIFIAIFGIRKLFTKAEVTDFYPTTCLGTWQSPQNAQDQPETFGQNASGTYFNDKNSAIYVSGSSSTGQIFCGGFLPSGFKSKGDIQNIGLTLVWQIGSSTMADRSTFLNTTAMNTSTIITIISEQNSVTSTVGTPTTTSQSGNASSSSPIQTSSTQSQDANQSASTTPDNAKTNSPISTSSIRQSTSSTTATTTFRFIQPFAFLDIFILNRAFAQEVSSTQNSVSSTPIATTSIDLSNQTTTQIATQTSTQAQDLQVQQTTTTQHQAIIENTNFATSSATTTTETVQESSTVIIAPPIVAKLTPVVSSTATSTGAQNSTSSVSASTTPVSPAPPPPDDNFLQISYSIDGQNWIFLSKINQQNWQNLTIALPIKNWDDLKKLQIQIQTIQSTLTKIPDVYLDGMFTEVRYITDSGASDQVQSRVLTVSSSSVVFGTYVKVSGAAPNSIITIFISDTHDPATQFAYVYEAAINENGEVDIGTDTLSPGKFMIVDHLNPGACSNGYFEQCITRNDYFGEARFTVLP